MSSNVGSKTMTDYDMKKQFQIFCVTMLLFVVMLPSAALSEHRLRVVANIGGSEFSGSIKEPGGIFFDNVKQRLYITDTGNDRLLSFDKDFLFNADYSHFNFKVPVSIVKSKSGLFYFLDAKEGKIKIADPAKGTVEEEVYDFVMKAVPKAKYPVVPGRLKIDSEDNLYVIDKLNGRVLKFDINGEFKQDFNVNISKKSFYGISDIALHFNGNLYAVDSAGRKVYIFNAAGKLTDTFGKLGDGKGDFKFPSSIAVDSRGMIFVTDKHKELIMVFSANGNYQYSLGSPGEIPGKFRIPSYITIDDKDRIFIIDAGRVQVLKEMRM